MSYVFREGMARRGSKSKTRTYRKIRHSKKRLQTTRRFSGRGPAQGLSLTYDPDDFHFPGRWVLSFGDLILGVSRNLCLDLWNRLTGSHQDQCRESFEPVPVDVQEHRRRLDNEEFRRMMFWDKVTRAGRKKHAQGPITSVAVVSPRGGTR